MKDSYSNEGLASTGTMIAMRLRVRAPSTVVDHPVICQGQDEKPNSVLSGMVAHES